MNKVYMIYTKAEGIFGSFRTLQGTYSTRQSAEVKRIEILLTTKNGPDDVTIEEVEVLE